MIFARPSQNRRATENIVPMINVVFLLLIFFVITAQITPPEPFEVTPPESAAREEAEPDTLYIRADGTFAYEGAVDDAAFTLLRTRNTEQPLAIRADADLRAGQFAALLPKLAEAGVQATVLITGGR